MTQWFIQNVSFYSFPIIYFDKQSQSGSLIIRQIVISRIKCIRDVSVILVGKGTGVFSVVEGEASSVVTVLPTRICSTHLCFHYLQERCLSLASCLGISV